MNTEKYLPLGSVVNIENYDKDIMIIGYMCYSKDNNEIVSAEYMGVPIEEGLKETNKVLFNKNNITNVIFIGYKTEEIINKLKYLDEILKILDNCKDADEFFNEVEKRGIKAVTSSKVANKAKSTVLKEEK
jgi:hypothetical protein